MPRERRPAVAGWFTSADGAVRLVGTRCVSCGTPYFPRNDLACRNPGCTGPRDGSELEEHTLSPRGRVWSFTDSRYRPPPPYVSPDPFVPFTIAAVELAAERMVVLGQVVPGHPPLEVGMEVELTEATLYAEDDTDYTTWMWSPLP
ncbi:Zn-ribbon domain-containing OB-fold protein [Spirillospora sp. CA-294931]|uniref:Zn-ribbon domain-containing OB-fold protein n=1 Tax=Spirillospora sp. CA-294931 TaxID=3240042 RepID=UPI003D89C348